MQPPRNAGRRLAACLLSVGVGLLLLPGPGRAQDDSEALLQRVRDLLSASASQRFITPMPGSRSNVVAVDGSADIYFFIERGSLRGSRIDEFYEQLEAGDMDAAYRTFIGGAIITFRATDYGWNGLGTPWMTDSGTEVQDILFKVDEGTFGRGDITEEDSTDYLGLLRDVILPALEGGS